MKSQSPSRPSAYDSFAADDVLREVWRVRDEISASHGNNIEKLCDALRERERQSGRNVVNLSKPRGTDPS